MHIKSCYVSSDIVLTIHMHFWGKLNPQQFLLVELKIFMTVMNGHFSVAGCGHCKKAKPEFMAAAEKFKDDGKVSDCVR